MKKIIFDFLQQIKSNHHTLNWNALIQKIRIPTKYPLSSFRNSIKKVSSTISKVYRHVFEYENEIMYQDTDCQQTGIIEISI